MTSSRKDLPAPISPPEQLRSQQLAPGHVQPHSWTALQLHHRRRARPHRRTQHTMRAATTLLRRTAPRWARSVFIQVEKTPNPFSLKFLPSQPVKLGAETSSGFHFTKGDAEANKSPLARKLFTVDHVTGVFIQQDFVTVLISASRGAAAPSRHRRASSPGEEVVGDFFFDFEAVWTESSDRDAPRRSVRTTRARGARSSPTSFRT